MKKIFTTLLTAGAILMNATQTQAQDLATAKATFAGGCFWCMEKPYDQKNGVIDVVSGYINGHIENPTYKQVSSGKSGHVEAIQVTYNPSIVSYEELLKIYWVNIDPTVINRQFCDVGEQYRSEIFYHDENQKQLAEASKADLIAKGYKVETKIVKAETFYNAEDYHQDYYTKNPLRYKYYRYSCGRDARLDELWGEARTYPADK
tara:strand:+ start:66442 stop:67056 length:615 start_codon:yes stop_codon:yes gene_type:complete